MVAGVSIGSTRSLGVRLTGSDVASAISAAAQDQRRVVPKVHYPVGTQATVLQAASRFSPAWANRLVNLAVSSR